MKFSRDGTQGRLDVDEFELLTLSSSGQSRTVETTAPYYLGGVPTDSIDNVAHNLEVRCSNSSSNSILEARCSSNSSVVYLAGDCRLIRRCRSSLRSSSSATKLEVSPTRTTFGDWSFAVDAVDEPGACVDCGTVYGVHSRPVTDTRWFQQQTQHPSVWTVAAASVILNRRLQMF